MEHINSILNPEFTCATITINQKKGRSIFLYVRLKIYFVIKILYLDRMETCDVREIKRTLKSISTTFKNIWKYKKKFFFLFFYNITLVHNVRPFRIIKIYNFQNGSPTILLQSYSIQTQCTVPCLLAGWIVGWLAGYAQPYTSIWNRAKPNHTVLSIYPKSECFL